MKVLFSALFLALLLFPPPAFAGGDGQFVRVQKLTMQSDTDYVLVVLPEPDKSGYKDFYMGDCKRFEVHGTLQSLNGTHWFIWWNTGGAPTKEQHLAALAYLKKFEGSPKTILFGWMGSGFKVIDPNNPCIVESRGLRLFDDPEGVLSFFNAI